MSVMSAEADPGVEGALYTPKQNPGVEPLEASDFRFAKSVLIPFVSISSQTKFPLLQHFIKVPLKRGTFR